MDRHQVVNCSSLATRLPLWLEPVHHTDYKPVIFPPTKPEDAEKIVKQLNRLGGDSVSIGESYDALWKYGQALLLCYDYPSLKPETAALHSNIAAVCLKMGDSEDNDPEDPHKFASSQLCWYALSLHHVCRDLPILDPESEIVHKVFYQRKETLEKIISFSVKVKMKKKKYKDLVIPPETNHIHAIKFVEDFEKYFQLQRNPDPRVFCHALMFAVDHEKPAMLLPRMFCHNPPLVVNNEKTVDFLPNFDDKHVVSGFTSQLLPEIIACKNSTSEHILYLLEKTKMKTESVRKLNYDASMVSASQLLRKKISNSKLFLELIDRGMPVKPEDVAYVVCETPKLKNIVDILKVLIQNCKYSYTDKDLHNKTLEAANIRGKNSQQFKKELKDATQIIFDLHMKEAESYFREKRYPDALSFYRQALEYCYDHSSLKEQRVFARSKCGITCLKMESFKNAYDYCAEWVKFNPECHEAYFYRAEALKGILSRTDRDSDGSNGKTYRDVIKDYIECHRRTSHRDAFYNAVILGHKYSLTGLIPKLQDSDVKSGLSTDFLRKVVDGDDLTEALLKFVIIELPSVNLTKPYDASKINLARVILKTTDYKLTKCLLDLNMKVKQSHIVTAVTHVPLEDTSTFELLLEKAVKIDQPTFASACRRAIVAMKFEFVVLLIKKGATPAANELIGKEKFFDNPIIKEYLSAHPEPEHTEKPPEEIPNVKKWKKRIRDLTSGAIYCYEDHQACTQALIKYYEALEICQTNRLSEEAASIHGQCACILFRAECYNLAYRHADASIKLSDSSSCDMLYIWRAESLKKLLKSRTLLISASLTYKDVIDDYFMAHDLKENIDAVVEAILLAVNYDWRCMVMYIQKMPLDTCNKVLLEILTRSECKEAHLEFLMNKMWVEKEINVSEVTLKQLVVHSELTSSSVLQRFLELGMPLSKEDIKLAIHYHKDAQIELFDVLTAKSNAQDLNEFCQTAVIADRIPLVLKLIIKGADIPTCTNGSQLLLTALQFGYYNTAVDLTGIFTQDTVDQVDLSYLMHPNIVNCTNLIQVLIRKGVNPNGQGGKHPIRSVMDMADLSLSEKITLVQILLKNGADCNHLCETGKSSSSSTPLHKATELTLKSGDVRLIKSVVCSSTFNPKNTVNDKGETPLHLVVKSRGHKKEDSAKVLSALLETKVLDPTKRDHARMRPIDYCLNQSDRRYIVLKSAMDILEPESPQQIKDQTNNKTMDLNQIGLTDRGKRTRNSSSSSSQKKQHEMKFTPKDKEPLTVPVEYKDRTIPGKLEFHLKRVMDEEDHYFQGDETKTITSTEKVASSPQRRVGHPSKPKEEKSEKDNVACSDEEDEPIAAESCDDSVMVECGLDFDELPWEVEVTSNVVKFLKNTKKISPEDWRAALRTMHRLAEGMSNKHLSKRVGSEKSLHLYEARITKAARILWEKAISYSSKLTGTSPIPVYTEVIRVWEIVLDHDDLGKRIKYCSEQIRKSHRRGSQVSCKLSLKAEETEEREKVRGRKDADVPMRFLQHNTHELVSDYNFIPAASTKDNEYNVTTFHEFDTTTAKSMLYGTNDRRDFPFKEWQKEHEIIKLSSKEAILLLGRSGTGKTTCCLYRLWNDFKNFWTSKCSTSSDIEDVSHSSHQTTVVAEDMTPLGNTQEYNPTGLGIKKNTNQDETTAISGATLQEKLPSSEEFEGENSVSDIVEEKLHQVFITKNYILCDKMKKHFYDLAAAFDFLSKQMEHENTNFVSDLSKADDYAFPLFLTARQFYILLDKSLGGKRFFKWNDKGELDVDILSLDYQHEDLDTLLDLEESDDEDELSGTPLINRVDSFKQHDETWTEVTALYFKEFIWPKISNKCNISSKEFDPLLVWGEIQSFIKGSELALRKGDHLSLEEYEDVGNKMAPHYASHRPTIYNVFLEYKKYKKGNNIGILFDECDLVTNLFDRLTKLQRLPWLIHSMYIDEVQDFTQAELTNLIYCCSDPNSMFFTGDTAQSIMRGIAFRFQDLRSVFYNIQSNDPKVMIPKKPHKLTINFRSHSGILKLAGSIIDLISEFFKDSIDHLPDDEGMFPGPTPVLLESCKIDDLALLLSTNKREASAIEFGAHQVIIVQSKEAKESLPPILKGAIVLTIFEAKGLEFSDVLLYNFFTDSMVDEKGWRVVSSYLEFPTNHKKITNPTKLPGSTKDPRSCQFDATVHKSLISELKYLYTAITRAKCNLWIYDENTNKACLPMFNYWHKRGLVKVVKAQSSEEDVLFASNSTPEQWKTQGDNFKKQKLWEQAIHCYQQAGTENQYLAKEAEIYHLIQRARYQKPQFYLEAAVGFLECDQLRHNLQYLKGAAVCLRYSQPPKYHEAAKLFEKLGKLVEAARLYKETDDINSYARVEERRGHMGHIKKVTLFKETKKYDEAFKALLEKNMYKDAYRLAVAQGCTKCTTDTNETWLQRGLKNAEEHNNIDMKATFLFQIAKLRYKELKPGKKCIDNNDRLCSDLNTLLQNKNQFIKAQAHLLLGMLMGDKRHCHTAWKIYHASTNHRVGELEAFNQVLQLTDPEEYDELIINMCRIANETSNVLMTASSVNRVVKEGLRFYGLQKIGVYYYTPPGQDIWFGELLMSCVHERNKYDLDGMIRLVASKGRSMLASHCQDFVNKWLSQCQVIKKLQHELTACHLNSSLLQCQQLSDSKVVSEEQLSDYLHTIVKLVGVHSVEENIDSYIAIAVSIFTPDVYFYLPDRIKEIHISIVRRSFACCSKFESYVKRNLSIDNLPSQVSIIDLWLKLWRVSCINEASIKLMYNLLQKLERKVNDAASIDQNFKCPSGYIYWEKDKKFYHIISIWLKSCLEMREKGRLICSSKLAINHFIGRIALQADECQFQVINAVDILSIHCTGILAMLAHIRGLQKYPTPCTVPRFYTSNVHVFSLMNSWNKEDHQLLSACANEVNRSRDIEKLFDEGCHLLLQALEFILGTDTDIDAPNYSILSMELNGINSSKASIHCLILTFVLLGNLSMLSVFHIQTLFERLKSLLSEFIKKRKGEVSKSISIANKAAEQPNFLYPPEVFKLVRKLLHEARLEPSLVQLVFRDIGSNSDIDIIPLETINTIMTEKRDLLESESDIAEDDVSISLSTGTTTQHLSQLNPDILDPTIVSSTFCNACGVILRDDNTFLTSDDDKQVEVSTSMPVYSAHVNSELHNMNCILCKKFIAEVSPLDLPHQPAVTSIQGEIWLYHILRFKLDGIFTNFEELKKRAIQSNLSLIDKLDRSIGDIKDEVEKNDKLVSKLEEKCNWRKAIQEVDKMKDVMDRQLNQCKGIYQRLEKLMQNQKDEYFLMEKDGDDLDTPHDKGEDLDQLEILSEFDEHSVGTQRNKIAETYRLRSEEDKLKSRERKKGKTHSRKGL